MDHQLLQHLLFFEALLPLFKIRLRPRLVLPTPMKVSEQEVFLISVVMLVIGFVAGYATRVWKTKEGVPVLDDEYDRETTL